MNINERDKRALILLLVGIVVFAIVMLATRSSDSSVKIVQAAASVPRLEKQLDTLRRTAGTLPAREQVYKQVSAELADREKGLIQADTAAQAQARLVQILREVAKNQTPPLEIRQTELGQARSFGQFYGEVPVSITMECRTDQLVNFMAFLSAQPELIATEEIRFGSGNPKTKIIPVRLTVTGIVPRKLVPEKKATTLF
jgi:Tfp pilus assembly protein PilO